MIDQQLIPGFKGFEQFSTVICIDNKDVDGLTLNAEYKVYNDAKYHNLRGVGVEIFNDSDASCFYHPDRFITKETKRDNSINTIINE